MHREHVTICSVERDIEEGLKYYEQTRSAIHQIKGD